MDENISSYRLVWSEPICQNNVKKEFIIEERPFKFTSMDGSVLDITFSFDSSLPFLSLTLTEQDDSSFEMNMGVDSTNSLPIEFTEQDDSSFDINFSLN